MPGYNGREHQKVRLLHSNLSKQERTRYKVLKRLKRRTIFQASEFGQLVKKLFGR